MSILSIQSHVVYGYVGNKAAVYPLQSMGYDVWPINTVQFSSHTGYKEYQGDIFSRDHLQRLVKGLIDLGEINKCKAILSGYMGSEELCWEVFDTVKKFKSINDDIMYLCDPVIGNTHCYVKPEVLDFFKNNLKADIITPNQFEAETLSNIKINDLQSLLKVSDYFHNRGIRIVIITGIKDHNITNNKLMTYISDKSTRYLVEAEEYNFTNPVNGTGDLFSALFLGSYLAYKNILDSAINAIFYTNLVIKNTFLTNSRELQLIGNTYDLLKKEGINFIQC